MALITHATASGSAPWLPAAAHSSSVDGTLGCMEGQPDEDTGLEPNIINPAGHEDVCADLETKGYLLLPSFLTPSEVAEFASNFREQPAPAYEGFQVKIPPYEFLTRFVDKFRVLTDCVARTTGIHADLLTGGVYFFTAGRQVFGWHQDRESFYTCQNHRDYLNFYIPIIKPDKQQSNLSVIPLDRLHARDPAFFDKIRGRGAALFEVRGGKTVMQDENHRVPDTTFDVSLDELADTPALEAGDLLLLRGDVIHRTQDANTLRMALSVRFANSRHRVSKGMLVRGGAKKFGLMVHQHIRYQMILRYMDRVGQDSVTLEEIFNPRFGHSFRDESMMSRSRFFIYLLGHKIRMGLFADTLLLLVDLLRSRLRLRTRLRAALRFRS